MNNIENCITISNRNSILIKGVNDILSYDRSKIVLDMESSQLVINGADFNVKKIDVESKCAEITGIFISLAFSDNNTRTGKSFLTSLFK